MKKQSQVLFQIFQDKISWAPDSEFCQTLPLLQQEMISPDKAAKILLEDAHHLSMVMRSNSAAKVRRLYDITNVLCSMNFIEKTHHPETRRPAFRWLGMIGKSQSASVNDLILETKKRTFGTELTNTSFKRCKVVPTVDTNTDQATETQVKCETLDENNLEEGSRQNYQFCSFAPIHVPKAKASDNNKGKQVFDWESLASTYPPQYHNQGITLEKCRELHKNCLVT